MSTTRTFVALLLPCEVRASIGDLRQASPTPPGLRWSAAHQAHLTLVFLGDLANATLRSVAKRTEEVAAATHAFGAELAGVGSFPRPDRARVVWTGWGQGADAVARLQAALTQVLGRPAERRPFTPHVTIARARAPLDLRAWLERMPPYRSPAWHVAAVAVMASELGAGGATHNVVARCPLAAL